LLIVTRRFVVIVRYSSVNLSLTLDRNKNVEQYIKKEDPQKIIFCKICKKTRYNSCERV